MIGYKKQWKKIDQGESTIDKKDFLEGVSGVWNIGTCRPSTIANFPERLPQLCIDLLSYKNNLVLDPFNGGGTTSLVAEKLGRRWIGIELSEKYCNITKEKLSFQLGFNFNE